MPLPNSSPGLGPNSEFLTPQIRTPDRQTRLEERQESFYALLPWALVPSLAQAIFISSLPGLQSGSPNELGVPELPVHNFSHPFGTFPLADAHPTLKQISWRAS
jgi:hypothetical protein